MKSSPVLEPMFVLNDITHIKGTDLERYILWAYEGECDTFEIQVSRPCRLKFTIHSDTGLSYEEQSIVDECVKKGNCQYHHIRLFLRELIEHCVLNYGSFVLHFEDSPRYSSHFMLLYK